jgi:hypothetical protein
MDKDFEYDVEVLVTTRVTVRCFGSNKELAQDHADMLVRSYYQPMNFGTSAAFVHEDEHVQTKVKAKRAGR